MPFRVTSQQYIKEQSLFIGGERTNDSTFQYLVHDHRETDSVTFGRNNIKKTFVKTLTNVTFIQTVNLPQMKAQGNSTFDKDNGPSGIFSGIISAARAGVGCNMTYTLTFKPPPK